MMKIPVSIFLVMTLSACGSHQVRRYDAAEFDLRHYILAPLPQWAKDSLYEGYYLDIDGVMRAEKLSRLEAIEVQNQMRDRLGADLNASILESYQKALSEVRAGRFESGWKAPEFKSPGEFVVAIDAVKLAPGAEEFILRMKTHPRCRGVVIFSAKEDAEAIDRVRQWKFKNGDPASKWIDGVFTRNHLVLGKGALIPSKDLRAIDPSLKHVVLIDDHPARVVQHALLKAHPGFDADQYLKSVREKKKGVASYSDAAFEVAAIEIEETSRAAEKLKISFSRAFLPYSYSGMGALKALEKKMGSRSEALKLTRLHSD